MIIAPVITIDGPSGSGKGTLCNALAKALQWHVLDSGAIYRVMALASLNYQISLDREEQLVPVARNLNVHFKNKLDRLNVIFEGADVSQVICNEDVAKIASTLAKLPHVREALMQRQYAFRMDPGLIADGRDMGTVVFPDAVLKIFLDATPEERAYRRMQQLQKNGISVNFKRLLSEIKERDDRDRNRVLAPLTPATSALMLDSTCMTINEVIVQVLTYAKHVLALS